MFFNPTVALVLTPLTVGASGMLSIMSIVSMRATLKRIFLTTKVEVRRYSNGKVYSYEG